ncbi:MAG: hypothetical protein DRQ46_03855 [Gammaproteobacteria bacterium]|nr:MAG: hypothetical protein DRQ46_03855 [Gammaproteobacteria bacterium]
MSWHKVKEFECPDCDKSFKTKRQLKSHMKDAHGAAYRCKSCGIPAIKDELCVRCHEEA